MTTTTLVNRILPPAPLTSLQHYLDQGGGRGLAAARLVEPEAVIAEIEESGLTARGGAGAPCGPKWRTGRAYSAGAAVPPTVVVNAAEGEPGSFKDRAILLRNPYQVIEGALIAAHAIGACDVIIAMKRMHGEVRRRIAEALDEARAAGWLDGVDVQLFEGPNEYLYGEETAMLEAIDGRPPFPRIAPPYRRGVHEIVDPATAADASAAARADGRPEQRGVRFADAREQRRDVGQRAGDPCPRAGLVPFRGNSGVTWFAGLHGDWGDEVPWSR